MSKISVWLTNSDPGTELEVPLWGLVLNKTVVEVEGPLYEPQADGSLEPVDFLVLGEPIPPGEEYITTNISSDENIEEGVN